jgi:C-terminal peptidase prc
VSLSNRDYSHIEIKIKRSIMHQTSRPAWLSLSLPGRIAVLFLLMGTPGLVMACSDKSSPGSGEIEVDRRLAGNDPVAILQSNRVGVALTGSAGTGQDTAKSASGARDYWKAIPFNRTNFNEVRTFVQQRYIDRNVDSHRAYAEASSFALASDEKRGFLLVPLSFYKKRKGHIDEEGRLSGKMYKLRQTDGFVILEFVKPKKKKKRRLNDDEIRVLRKKLQERNGSLEGAWKTTRFGSDEFQRVMDFVAIHLGKDPKWSMKMAYVAAAQGYLYSLDPHSSMIPRKAWEESTRETTDASFEGIGAILTRRPDSDYTIVESPIEGQPAVKAGIRAGDVIIKVDGKDIKGELLSKVVKRIRGRKGTTVVLTVEREGLADLTDIPIVRASIDIKNVSGRMVANHKGIGYIKLTGFVKTTTLEMQRHFKVLSKKAGRKGLRGLVLDLRRNSGGLLQQGISVADQFLSRGTIVTVKSRNGGSETDDASPGGWTVPVVVLVNDGSASASEIVASAIQENGRGLVVGDRTFGKASVQTLYSPLTTTHYYIKLTVARYYSPLGRTLQVVGVQPDIAVPPSYGKKMPLGFREENLSHHLAAIKSLYPNKNTSYRAKIKTCVEKSGRAKKLHMANPNPAIKFDYQLMYGADALECMMRIPRSR